MRADETLDEEPGWRSCGIDEGAVNHEDFECGQVVLYWAMVGPKNAVLIHGTVRRMVSWQGEIRAEPSFQLHPKSATIGATNLK